MEDEDNCWDDCMFMPNCGDDNCQEADEDIDRCPADCWCGNQTCDPLENGNNCDLDCKEENCSDNNDDDNDGMIDCADPDCQDDPVCGINCGQVLDCMDDCGSNAGCRSQCPVDRCANAVDAFNNFNGCLTGSCQTPCADLSSPQCIGCLENSCPGQFLGCLANTCGPEIHCQDEQDHDNDGLTDCEDQDCHNNRVCPESLCGDGADNDNDGVTDCDDPDCNYDPACYGCNNSICQPGDETNCPDECAALEVSAGGGHVCAVLTDGTVWCWGLNTSGQLGIGTEGPGRDRPVRVEGIMDAVQVTAGGHHTCVLVSDSSIWCWGRNDNGQLGDGTNQNSPVPVPVNPSPAAAHVSAGGQHTCAIATGGQVFCWGTNDSGQLGIGTTTSHNTPQQVGNFTNGGGVSAGLYHTCVFLSDQTARCWGNGGEGRLGHGSNVGSLTPVQPTGLSGVSDIAAGGAHSCAIHGSSTSCWGANESGQLGTGDATPSSIPAAVDFIAGGLTAISAGNVHTCAMAGASPHGVKCWGDNRDGQLGHGTDNTIELSAVDVLSLQNVLSVSAGGNDFGGHSCAVTGDGVIWCWGSNDAGRLGNGPGSGVNTPQRVEIWSP
jgi:alpha-tubulin suppressor-like RCC1 family protein